MSQTLDATLFRRCLGEEFRPQQPGLRALTLREVKDLGGDSTRADHQPFSLIFADPGAQVDDALPQAIYHLHNHQLGEVGIFLVCLGPDLKDAERPLLYEAIFS
ncbi:MAG: hypothetical protein KDI71_01070 [Xanthomonadales bacterium]|nr:hypothetical protein [Xanthomonadales bacterium]